MTAEIFRANAKVRSVNEKHQKRDILAASKKASHGDAGRRKNTEVESPMSDGGVS
jgi:hypothetical protein